MKKFAALATIAGVMALGGTAAADDYPPEATTATTAATGGLPATGSDNNDTLVIGAGILVAGAGLLAVTRIRRRPAAA